MRQIIFFSVFLAQAQTIPIRLGDPINLVAPVSGANGNTVVFAAAMSPDGVAQKGTNLYLFAQGVTSASVRRLTNYAGDSALTGVSSVAYANGFAGYAATPSGPGGAEEVHLIDANSSSDRTLATDREGCIQPLCVSCFRSCVGPVHVSPDAGKVLYAVARQQPFYVVNADGSGLTRLPVYQGALAPSPQRAISRAGLVVFTSSAPSGPTFAAAATDVYTMSLDGTGLRPVTKFGDSRFFAGNATISADGSTIAFESNYSAAGPAQANQVWAVRPDGSGLTQLSTGPDAARGPSISADGSVVTFLQSGQIRRVRTTGDGAVVTLTALSISAPLDAVLSDDGSTVVFSLGPVYGGAASVYRIPADRSSGRRAFGGVFVPRFLNPAGVGSAAGYGAPSPGSLISVYGCNLGLDELTQAGGFPLPSTLSDVELLVNGQPVPLLAATPWQINAQLPQTVPPGTATVQARFTGGFTLPPITAEIKNTSPANFAFPFTRGPLGYTQAAAYHTGTVVAADLDHPAAAGETLEIYGLGLGVTDPMVEAGMPSPSAPPAGARQMPRVQIGGRDAVVSFAGLVPGLAGVYQVNVQVPAGLAPGVQNLAWRNADGALIYSSIAVK